MRAITFLVGWACFLLGTNISADQAGPMTPLPEEKLPKPIYLQEECRLVAIREWRINKSDQTGPERYALGEIDKICQEVVVRFPDFIKYRNLKMEKSYEDFFVSLSLIPDDSKSRDLNDLEGRFNGRSSEYDEKGKPLPILGYHQRDADYIYLYNEVLEDGHVNLQFRVVLAHEFYHAMSWQYGIYQQYQGNKDLQEEKMAKQFTDWLGYTP